jgi:hypothetical protein
MARGQQRRKSRSNLSSCVAQAVARINLAFRSCQMIVPRCQGIDSFRSNRARMGRDRLYDPGAQEIPSTISSPMRVSTQDGVPWCHMVEPWLHDGCTKSTKGTFSQNGA